MKRMIALLLVFLFSIESFAAVVSDNDGAAFITNELSAYLIQFNFSNRGAKSAPLFLFY